MSPIFSQVVIIGLGLIGGSIALCIKEKNKKTKIVGIDLSSRNRREALHRGAVDEVHQSLGEFIREADLVILAVPVRQIKKIFPLLKPYLSPKTLVTDVGSTKSEIAGEARKLKIRFVGGHPIAGTENSGMKAAEKKLFESKKWILTPLSSTTKTDLQRLSRFVRTLGARPTQMAPSEHDDLYAALSHLPNLLSFTLQKTVLNLGQKRVHRFAGTGLKDMTRLSKSPPEMWRDILLSNQKAVLKWIKAFEKKLGQLYSLLESQKEKELYSFLKT